MTDKLDLQDSKERIHLKAIFSSLNEMKRLSVVSNPRSCAEVLFSEIDDLLSSASNEKELLDIFDWSVVKAIEYSVLGVWSKDFKSQIGLDESKNIEFKVVKDKLGSGPEILSKYLDEKLDYLWTKFGINADDSIKDESMHVKLLCNHLRAGYSKEGTRKLIFFPKESQADHSMLTTVYSRILSILENHQDPTASFLSFYHHLPMTRMPDIDHAVESIVGLENKKNWEDEIISQIVNEGAFSDFISGKLNEAFSIIHGRLQYDGMNLFNEADFIDRVIQVKYYIESSKVDLPLLVEDYALLNDGEMGRMQREIIDVYEFDESDGK